MLAACEHAAAQTWRLRISRRKADEPRGVCTLAGAFICNGLW
jgi:hypothetical protein